MMSVPDASRVGSSRCGYVAIIGRPNVGKSTLLNHLLGQKLSITSRKPQTTRNNLLGIQTQGATQTIYVDTPGIHDPRRINRATNRSMVRAATSVLQDVDIIVAVVEPVDLTPDDERVLERLHGTRAVRLCVINKIDQLDDRRLLLPQIDALAQRGLFDEIVPVSVLKNDGLDRLVTLVHARLPSGPHLFPSDQISDRSERFMVGEIVREKLMRRIGDELPHRSAVVVERFIETDTLVDISADIYVERGSQKAIIIGKRGARLKSIGQDARQEIERFLGGRKVMLRLWVKVRADWTEDAARLQRFGFD